MTDQLRVDLASVVANLLQQQTALLQVHAESVRMQCMLVERLLGTLPGREISAPPRQPELRTASEMAPQTSTPAAVQLPATPAPQAASAAPVQRSESGSGPAEEVPPAPGVAPAVSASPTADDETARLVAIGTGDRRNAAYTARYYRAPPSATFAPVQPQDLELLRRLREIPEASGLILQFGPHKDDKLGQVAVSNPEYIRQLVIRAQRPEVRAAAARLIEAIDAAAEHKRRASRSSSRRSRASA
jgi:hypothetical protein